MTGKLKFTLANSALGSIITHALVNEEGTFIVSAESGDVLYWSIETRSVIFQENQPDVQQLFFYKNQTRCIAISRKGEKGIQPKLNHSLNVIYDYRQLFKHCSIKNLSRGSCAVGF